MEISQGFYFGDFGEYYVVPSFYLPKPQQVIFNNKATVVFWNDGTKTVVNCDKDDEFQEEFGFAMACMKKLFGSRSNFKAQFKNAVRQKSKVEKQIDKLHERANCLSNDFRAVVEEIERYQRLDASNG